MVRSFLVSLVAVAVALAACGGSEPSGAATRPSAEAARLVLATDPGNAQSVVAAKTAGTADKAVVTGRVTNIVPGFAVFTLMDLALPYCGEKNKEDGCKTPWDYCCESAPTRTANALVVEARGSDGKPMAMAALPEVRLLDQVTVAGRLIKDENGNPVLVANGWYRKDRPTLRADVRLPH